MNRPKSATAWASTQGHEELVSTSRMKFHWAPSSSYLNQLETRDYFDDSGVPVMAHLRGLLLDVLGSRLLVVSVVRRRLISRVIRRPEPVKRDWSRYESGQELRGLELILLRTNGGQFKIAESIHVQLVSSLPVIHVPLFDLIF